MADQATVRFSCDGLNLQSLNKCPLNSSLDLFVNELAALEHCISTEFVGQLSQDLWRILETCGTYRLGL